MKTLWTPFLILASAVGVATTPSAQAPITQGVVIDLATNGLVPDAYALLLRDPSGVAAYISTRDLQPNAAHSVWIAITEDDGDFFVFNVTGGPSTAQGRASFAAYTPEGPIPAADGSTVLVNAHTSSGGALGNGLFDDPANATIEYTIRTHGPLLMGLQGSQCGTAGGGCGTNAYANVQLVLF